MARNRRIPKTIHGKLTDLDDHLFLLRDQLRRLYEEPAHLKAISAELRVLACTSSGTRGLLWRLTHELAVSDTVAVHIPVAVDSKHPLAQDLHIAFVPLRRAGEGDPSLGVADVSLGKLLATAEAVYVDGRHITHEYLIKAIAQQMGSAHEDDGIESTLAHLGQVTLNGAHPYVQILATDAELVLQVGERILEKATANLHFTRNSRRPGYGDVTIALRLGFRRAVDALEEILSCSFPVSDVVIRCVGSSDAVSFDVTKAGTTIGSIACSLPPELPTDRDILVAFGFSSQTSDVFTTSDVGILGRANWPRLGWLHADDIRVELPPDRDSTAIYRQSVLCYERLLTPKDCMELLQLPPDGEGLWLTDVPHQL